MPSPSQVPASPALPVDLLNCDREPIHIPGSIQSHGALLAWNGEGVLVAASEGAAAVLGTELPAIGETLQARHFGGAPEQREAMDAFPDSLAPTVGVPAQYEVTLGGRVFDLIAHHNGDLLVTEFEPRGGDDGDPARFASLAHRALGRLRHLQSVEQMLALAVEEVRSLTGFDRVMAYRFRHDESGDIVAEARREDLVPFLHRRYPASDIPAQARRLYVINTLRLIGDVAAPPVPVLGLPGAQLNLSWSTLRSVSPIHIEYLTNMGVQASMSVSIVVDGQLWGMLACHHLEPRVVPYAVRMACDVLAQLLSSKVQTLIASERARQLDEAATIRARLIEHMLHDEEPLAAVEHFAPELATAFGAGGVVLGSAGRVLVTQVEAPVAEGVLALLDSLDRAQKAPNGVWAASTLAGVPAESAAALGTWCGVLAMLVDEPTSTWLVMLRREQIHTVQWGGKPEKIVTIGPLGPRLTPRGSFDIWRETVRGQAVPWTPNELEMAKSLRSELARAAHANRAELDRSRARMLAILGHDLRTPLQTISMAAHMLERGGDAQLGARIKRSSGRMERLITQALDVSRLQNGLGLGLARRPLDLSALALEVLQDAMAAHPEQLFASDFAPDCTVEADADRVNQLLDNLLGNAQHHGQPGRRIVVRTAKDATHAVLRVENESPPIPEAAARELFVPFKQGKASNERNRTGLGLGLYIAHEIAREHGGTLAYLYENGRVVFEMRLPRA